MEEDRAEENHQSSLLEFYIQRDTHVLDQVGRLIGWLNPDVRVVASPGAGRTQVGDLICRLVKRGDGERFEGRLGSVELPPQWGYVDERALAPWPKPLITPPALPSASAFFDQKMQTDLAKQLQRAADENGGLRMRLNDTERQLREAQAALEGAKCYFGPTAWKKWMAARSRWGR